MLHQAVLQTKTVWVSLVVFVIISIESWTQRSPAPLRPSHASLSSRGEVPFGSSEPVRRRPARKMRIFGGCASVGGRVIRTARNGAGACSVETIRPGGSVV
ncbi:hypothetical protein CH63R_07893 [Colletotrichum higginsianum IMI 349063]|uniref:Uncharacterized protein n=1 Tax=Colletotrichum higginsianum (strain IMI 349063) TaxID=759273 RepID=A0A1B7YB55_COLHI|nr:hypothetical protein CH63R_07893 [Colletotrichum higginsianum IMI 349063]OBR09128.1 hypothetical protein CH63R_07893 [Colletotrichum higginsianum IMI 349063]